MKYFILFFLLIPVLSIAQDVNSDSIQNNEFIEEYHQQLNIKLEVSNEIEKYKMSFLENKLILSPNIGLRYAIGFNYKFLSVRFGIRPGISDENKKDKGKSDNFTMRVKLLFHDWSHRLEYKYLKGFYIKNTDDFNVKMEDINYKIQFPNMKTSTFSGTSAYKFNKNYSVRATESQTEIQIKNVGTLMPSIDYWFYKISDLQTYINVQGDIIEREIFNKYQGVSTIVNVGYYYTFVYRKNWYVNLHASPGVGIDIYQVKTTTPDKNYTNNFNDFVFSFQSGAAIGFNSKRYYFGADFHNRITDENYSNKEFNFSTSKNIFHVFVGYRFKPPKTVSKTFEIIEEKVPILKDDD